VFENETQAPKLLGTFWTMWFLQGFTSVQSIPQMESQHCHRESQELVFTGAFSCWILGYMKQGWNHSPSDTCGKTFNNFWISLKDVGWNYRSKYQAFHTRDIHRLQLNSFLV